MLLNYRDFRLAKAREAQLGKALAGLDQQEHLGGEQTREARRAVMGAELARLKADIASFEELQDTDSMGHLSSDDLGLVPIRARISQQLSQRALADLVGLKEQQIQRYEAERYRGISLWRYQHILSALAVELQARAVDASVTPAAPFRAEELGPDLLRDLRRREWIDLPRGLSPAVIQDRVHQYQQRALALGSGSGLNRRSISHTPSDTAVLLWKSRVLQLADEAKGRTRGRFNLSDDSWLSQLVKMSSYADGPLRAADRLRDNGILLVIEPHLPQTHLDGAALLLHGSIPVVGLTLRHDRIDNFWFTLMHELAHIYLHYHRGLSDGFVDDVDEAGVSELEQQADTYAAALLIEERAWRTSPARFGKTKDLVIAFARSQNVHPAIVAGRIRRERDFALFTDMLGAGQVRQLFATYTS